LQTPWWQGKNCEKVRSLEGFEEGKKGKRKSQVERRRPGNGSREDKSLPLSRGAPKSWGQSGGSLPSSESCRGGKKEKGPATDAERKKKKYRKVFTRYFLGEKGKGRLNLLPPKAAREGSQEDTASEKLDGSSGGSVIAHDSGGES